MRRSRVVFPEPDGPSSAMSSPERMSSETSCSAGKRSNSLRILATRTSMYRFLMLRAGGCQLVGIAPFQPGLDDEGNEREAGEDRREAEGRDLRRRAELLVEELDLE